MDIGLEQSARSRKQKVKIAFFCGNMSHSGGTERVLSVIANELSERGHTVSVISLWGEGTSFFPLYKRIHVYWVERERHQKGIVGNFRYLTAILRHERPEYLIDVDMILGCYSFFLKWRRPDLCWISWEHFNYYYHFRKNCFLRKIIRRIAGRFADRLVVLTEEDKRYYQENMKLHCGISQIYNPLPYTQRASRNAGSLTGAGGLRPSKYTQGEGLKKEEFPVIFAAGRLTRAKGYDLLIQSWSLLEKRYPQWKVIVAGDGEEEKRLKRQAYKAGLKRFYFAGNVADIERYYEKAAFFVLPSRDEGFGMVLIEAMHFSLPVVAYRCKAGPGEIVDDGETGYLVEPGNVEAFAEKMRILMENEEIRRIMGEKAKKSVKRFDRKMIADEWESLLCGKGK